MEEIIKLILTAGRTGLDMALYTILPIMVVMLAVMRLLDAKGVIGWISRKLAPLTSIFGIPGLGLLAMLKLLFVSFVGPVPTLALMDKNGTSERHLAATLAMILAMSQANAAFPLIVLGLDIGITLMTSVIGGLAAASFTYYVLTRKLPAEDLCQSVAEASSDSAPPKNWMQLLSDGGQEGVRIVFSMLPMLILAIFMVAVLKAMGAIAFLSTILSPVLALLGFSDVVVLPLVTKFIGGGTAFMGISIDLLETGRMSALELNRMAGFVLNPFDPVGISALAAASVRLGGVLPYAIYGALFGMLIRGILHLIIF